MNVSIIIPTKNRFPILKETIACIFSKQKDSPIKPEVIVINDGEELPHEFGIEYPDVKVYKNKHKGAASARNTGAEAANTELLLFIDDDILIGENCIERHVKIHAEYQNVMASGTWMYEDALINDFKKTPFGRFKLKYDYKPDELDENRVAEGIYASNSLASFNLSIRKEDFVKMGGFDTDFPFAGCEDQEFSARVRSKGMKLFFDTLNVNINNEKDRADMDKWLMRQYTGVQGYVTFCNNFPEKKKEALYFENTPVLQSDSARLKIKKGVKSILSLNPVLFFIRGMTHLMELINLPDRVLFIMYNLLCGVYIFKGFRYSYKVQSVK